MRNKLLLSMLGCGLLFSSLTALADDTKPCNEQQQTKCGHFCTAHNGVQSCMLDLTQKDGTCTCMDGATHTKSK